MYLVRKAKCKIRLRLVAPEHNVRAKTVAGGGQVMNIGSNDCETEGTLGDCIPNFLKKTHMIYHIFVQTCPPLSQ